MMRIPLWVAMLAAVSLAGCSDEAPPGPSATLHTSDILPDDSQARTVACGSHATITIDVDGAVDEGSLTVKVREGNGVPVYEHRVHPGAADNQERGLDGGPGSWSLVVDRSLEFDAPAAVTLAC